MTVPAAAFFPGAAAGGVSVNRDAWIVIVLLSLAIAAALLLSARNRRRQ